MNNEALIKLTWEAVRKYSEMKLTNGLTIAVPYHINRMSGYLKDLVLAAGATEEMAGTVLELYKQGGVPYGRFRGKGSADQIKQIADDLLPTLVDYPEGVTSPEGMVRLMEFHGLGVDCSGFVYNVLSEVFERMGQTEVFTNSINWVDPERIGVNYAGTGVLAASSELVDWSEAEHGDLIFIKNESKERYLHVAMLLADAQDGSLYMAQSAFATQVSGVEVSNFRLENGQPIFGFERLMGIDWQEYLRSERLELRRLAVFKAM